jgi:hypothetical protein
MAPIGTGSVTPFIIMMMTTQPTVWMMKRIFLHLIMPHPTNLLMMQLSHFLHPHSSWTSARSSLRMFMVYGVGHGIEMVLSLQTVNVNKV